MESEEIKKKVNKYLKNVTIKNETIDKVESIISKYDINLQPAIRHCAYETPSIIHLLESYECGGSNLYFDFLSLIENIHDNNVFDNLYELIDEDYYFDRRHNRYSCDYDLLYNLLKEVSLSDYNSSLNTLDFLKKVQLHKTFNVNSNRSKNIECMFVTSFMKAQNEYIIDYNEQEEDETLVDNLFIAGWDFYETVYGKNNSYSFRYTGIGGIPCGTNIIMGDNQETSERIYESIKRALAIYPNKVKKKI